MHPLEPLCFGTLITFHHYCILHLHCIWNLQQNEDLEDIVYGFIQCKDNLNIFNCFIVLIFEDD